ncbi:nucleotidyltransferase domain-containing protein [Sulfurovum sp. bin170]|uniref:nucleotidyltransferase domain-containing protein n=1 Tax=Sulfurovum sp. bin170 TaxID=2695268 RepID=UPI0013DFB04B|nr:nucleotidyltransferase domain-containing protein [Sulfurovum sp. bin170]NEW61114.1 nucleotidyltransferase domain-containing protein [Sulfurovum sp. bin170]
MMRLSSRLIDIIKEATEHSFGDVAVYLFGSKVDDSKRGGDIDLAIETTVDRELFRKQKIAFKSFLFRRGYELKIDLVQYIETIDRLLFIEIEQNSIRLDNLQN